MDDTILWQRLVNPYLTTSAISFLNKMLKTLLLPTKELQHCWAKITYVHCMDCILWQFISTLFPFAKLKVRLQLAISCVHNRHQAVNDIVPKYMEKQGPKSDQYFIGDTRFYSCIHLYRESPVHAVEKIVMWELTHWKRRRAEYTSWSRVHILQQN